MPKKRTAAPAVQKGEEFSFEVLGTTGLRRSGGYVYEEFLAKLRGLKGVEFFKEFTENNPQAGAVRFVVESLIRQAGWTAEPAEDPSDPAQAELAFNLLESAMDDMEHGWQDMIVEMLSALRFGWSYANVPYKIRRGPDGPPEVCSEYDDGLIAWRSIEFRSQDSLDRWEFDTNGKLRGMWQMDGWTGVRDFIPIEQAVHFRIDKFKDNPEGRSMYRNGAISYLRLKNLDDIEAIGAEREMTGVPVMEVPPEMLTRTTSANNLAIRSALERMLGAFKRNEREYALIPSEMDSEGNPTGYKFRLMASPGTRAFDITKIKEAHKIDILVSCLSQFLMLGLGGAGVGSSAQAHSVSSMGLLGQALISILDMITDTINQQLVARMMRFNRFDRRNWPKVGHGDVDAPDMQALGTFLKTVFEVGAFVPTEQVQEKLYDMMKLPYTPPTTGAVGALPQGVKSADQLIADVMGQGTSTPPAGGGVKTADELIASVMSQTGAEDGAQTADELIAGVMPDATAPGTTPDMGTSTTGADTSVQDTAMNGTQVTSMLEVVTSVADGLLPRESALSILQIAFRLSPEKAEAVLGSVGAGFVPTKPAAPANPFGGGGGKPDGAPPFGGGK